MLNEEENQKYEVWLRGPIAGIPALLQPAAHALLQTSEEIKKYTVNICPEQLWLQPHGRASIAFHLQHITGVLDRMITYSKGKSLNESQFEFLRAEGKEDRTITIAHLIEDFDGQLDEALAYFKTLSEDVLKEGRTVGRKKLPSTVIGLLFHSAEHSQRHTGQMLVTASIVKSAQKN
ncbi:DinB family protein [Euzebyella marina]|uniref:DinB family protein n=1 Tax=Euzebyella marina TaxID=1761453 RepID=A0A3G2L447_9FLAO|nr:DinB family protein [Euzebyella marina]AYN67015.1 DinB family protein [Euzebyella marina]